MKTLAHLLDIVAQRYGKVPLVLGHTNGACFVHFRVEETDLETRQFVAVMVAQRGDGKTVAYVTCSPDA